MPVVKHHEFTNQPTGPRKASDNPDAIEPASESHRLDPRGHGRLLQPLDSAMDRAADPVGSGGVGLYVGLLVGAAIVLRILLAVLGPGTQPQLALTDSVEHQIALGESIIDGAGFALRPEHPAAPATAVASLEVEQLAPRDLNEAHHAFETLRRLRGEIPPAAADEPQPETRVLPGMPAMLGVFTLTGLPVSVLIFLQCLIGGLLVAPAYFATRNLTQLPAASLAAAVLIALHPGLLTAALTLDGTLWAVTLVTLGVWAVSWLWSDRPWLPALGGLSLGSAALIQPWTWAAVPALVWWRIGRQRDLAGVGLAVIFLIVAAAPPAAWMARNHQLNAGAVLTTDARLDRALGIPAQIASSDPDGQHLHDVPAAIASTWDDFVQELESPEQTPALANPFGPAVAPPPPSPTAYTLTSLRGFTFQRVLDNPAGLLGYGFRHTTQAALAPSTGALLPHLGVPYERAGVLTNLIGRGGPADSTDPITRWTTEVWIGLNAALLLGAGIGFVVCVIRRRFALVGLLGIAAVGFILLTPTSVSEADRLGLLLIQGVALATIAVTPAPRRVRKPKAKVGDFTADAPEGGFTIGLRSTTVTSLGTAGSHRAKGLMEHLPAADDQEEDEGEDEPTTPVPAFGSPRPTLVTAAAAPTLAGIAEVDPPLFNDDDDEDDDDDPAPLGRPI